MKNRKVVVFVASLIVIAMATIGIKYAIDFNYYKQTMSNLIISDVDVSKVSDGEYTGKHDAKIISAEVSVIVNDGEIIAIDFIEYESGKGEPALAIVDKIIEFQSLDVDTIAGATNSSKTILKAVENALE